jgi:hypothetical protein
MAGAKSANTLPGGNSAGEATEPTGLCCASLGRSGCQWLARRRPFLTIRDVQPRECASNGWLIAVLLHEILARLLASKPPTSCLPAPLKLNRAASISHGARI